jgi:hypothetical protein
MKPIVAQQVDVINAPSLLISVLPYSGCLNLSCFGHKISDILKAESQKVRVYVQLLIDREGATNLQ